MKTTFDRLMENPEWKTDFEKGYEEFLFSEFLIETMETERLSIRELAHKAGVSPTTIQKMRSGNAENIKLKTLLPVLQVLHTKIKFERCILE